MGMMTLMRDRMHIVLWALLILFLLSMSIGGLVGGADIIDQLLGKVDPRKAIGTVNGANLAPDQFMRLVNAELEQLRYQGQEITDQQISTIRDQIWDRMVTEILVKEALKKMNISATDEEVIFHLQENPPQFLTSLPDFETDGQFDQAKYAQAVANPQGNEWVPIEQHMKSSFIPNFKLEQLLNSSVTVTDAEIIADFRKRNIEYTIDALHAVCSKFDDAGLEPSDKEVQARYKRDIAGYEREETRHLRYVSWSKTPSTADSLRVFEEALSVKEQTETGMDFALLANQFTEDPGNAVNADSGRGGNLGWFTQAQMVAPFADAAFAARKGSLVGPVLTQFGYHVIKVNDKRTQNDRTEVNASHILFTIGMGANTREELRRDATLFSYDAQDYGFDAALDTHQVTARTAADLSAETIFVPGLGQFRSAVRFAFDQEPGISSTPLESDAYFAVVVVDSITPAGVRPLTEVREQIVQTLKREKQEVAALAALVEIRKQVEAGADFATIKAENEDLDLVTAEVRTLSRSFTSIGLSNFLVGALQEATVGELIGPVKTMRGYALARLLNVAKLDSTELEVQYDLLKNSLLAAKQQQVFNDWLKEMKDAAEIVDNRKYYF
ncbi:MAG: peptidylprolyl isomerase [Candidatus Neomarinimicrobiota bacterium]